MDAYKGTEAERKQVHDANAFHWGHDWIVLPNPSYGSVRSGALQVRLRHTA